MENNKLPDNASDGYYLATLKAPLFGDSPHTVLLYEGGKLYSFGSHHPVDLEDLDFIAKAPMDLDTLVAQLNHPSITPKP